MVVAIHASAQEATCSVEFVWQQQKVATHAPAQEATGQKRRARAGKGVSIHASAQEATRPSVEQSCPPRRFDPRLRAGGDCRSPKIWRAATCFDPRLRAGGDVETADTGRGRRRFDPRLRAGGDTRSRGNWLMIVVEIGRAHV